MSTLPLVAIIPLVLAVLGLFPRAARWLPGAAAGLMVIQVPVSLWACVAALQQGTARAVGADYGADGVSVVFVVLTTVVAAAALVQAALLFPAERAAEHHEEQPGKEGGQSPAEHRVTDQRLCFFYTLAGLFVLAMYGVLLAQNLGYLWIAMEATTLMSAPLIYFHRSQHALEATWKYLVLCSVGIAFALFGTVLIFAASQGQGDGGGTLLIGELYALGTDLDPRLLRLGFTFCILGYGTKAGIFPLHNWLPDAHSEAPAPASAMLSGSLLNCALVALWRISQVMTAAGQAELVRGLLVPAGAVTVFAAGLMLVRQHDLKRMWAYSSVEHVGLLTLAIGIGSGPVFLLHAINHSLVKTALFLLAGNILYLYGTKALSKLSGLLRNAPPWAILLAGASFAVAGSPPFGTFLSEWLLLRDTLAAGETWAAVLVIVGLTVTFIAVAAHVGRVLFGGAVQTGNRKAPPAWAVVPGVLLSLSVVAGLALGPPVLNLFALWTRGAGR